MTDPNNPCIFCSVKKHEIIYENEYAFVSYDSYPVSKFHSLIIPKRHIKNFFDLNDKELNACNELIKKIKSKIENADNLVEGFNLGTSAGSVAGQTIMHCHIHLIPRRRGDVENPQGGVRGVIPLKQHYLRKSK